jgi:hypothetical protein
MKTLLFLLALCGAAHADELAEKRIAMDSAKAYLAVTGRAVNDAWKAKDAALAQGATQKEAYSLYYPALRAHEAATHEYEDSVHAYFNAKIAVTDFEARR